MITRTCPICQQKYQADPGRLKHGRQTTCSRECSYVLRSQEQQTGVEMTCGVCEKVFYCRPSKAARAEHGVFCSRECHYKARSLGLVKRIVEKPYTYTVEGKQAMIESARRPKGKRVHHWLTCLNCEKEFDDPYWGRKRKSGQVFCSLDCCNAYRKGENNPSWRGGYPGYYGRDWRALRRAARKRDNYTCCRCSKDCNPPHRAPDVHHIKPVGSFENPNDANTLDNVVCLCHKCHMWVEWHGIDFPL